MQHEATRVRLHLLWQGRFYEHLGTVTPRCAQAPECRTIFVSARCQLRVCVRNVDRFCARRRPLVEFLRGGEILGRGEYTFGMLCPRPVRTIVYPRIDAHPPVPGLAPRPDDHLHCYATVLPDDHR